MGSTMEHLREWVEWAATGIELLAVAIIVIVIAVGTVRWLGHMGREAQLFEAYDRYRVVVGKSLLLGLELLVAADIIRTVALEPTLENVGILALLVLVRTFLGWTLAVEIEGRWPWQPEREERRGHGGPA
jgi:uncharacterized membrane protein